jgi:hypothetical protein
VVVDDEYIAHEERHFAAVRARTIEKHGSIEAYDAHCRMEAHRYRSNAWPRIRRLRKAAQRKRLALLPQRRWCDWDPIPAPATRAREPHGQHQRAGASSTTSSSDPGDDDPPPPPHAAAGGACMLDRDEVER